MRRLLGLAVVGLCVLVLGAGAWSLYHGGGSVVADVAVGLLLTACGLSLAAGLPANVCCWLLVAAGASWLVPDLAAAPWGLVATVAPRVLYLHRAFIVHLLLAYPTGRVSTRTGQVVTLAGYAAAILPGAWTNRPIAVGLSAAIIVAAAHQCRTARAVERRGRLAGAGGAIVFTAAVAGTALARTSAPSWLSDVTLLEIYEVALVAVAVVLTGGQLFRWWRPDFVTDLVVELGGPQAAAIRERLGQALGDPDIRIGYWLPTAGSFVDFDGMPLDPEDPEDSEGSRTIVRNAATEPVAVIIHKPDAPVDPTLHQPLAVAARLAAANAELRAEVQSRVADIAASRRRLVWAADAERERLVKRLHTGAERHLQAVADELRAAAYEDPTCAARIEQVGAQLARTRDELGRLARGLYPSMRSQGGVVQAIADAAARYPFRVVVDATGDVAPPAVAACAYFVVAEALVNAAKHASPAQVIIKIQSGGGTLVVAVTDDGVGGADMARGSGLRGLADRVQAMGGKLLVDSRRDVGTSVTATLPCSPSAVGGHLE